MKLFSKNVDYNLMLEKVLETKTFSSDAKNIFLNMLYKIENSYSDYKNVKKINKTKEQFLLEIIETIETYIDVVQLVNIHSEEVDLLKKHKVLAITNEAERSILAYPTENALLYAISDIKSKYYYMDEFIFKKELQQILVEGSDLNKLEILDDFNGWSWNPQNSDDENCYSKIIYQNLIFLLGEDVLEKSENSLNKDIDIINEIKNKSLEYYNCLIEFIFILNRSKKNVKVVEDKAIQYKKIEKTDKYLEEIATQKNNLQKKIRKIENLLSNNTALSKSFVSRNSKLDNSQKIKKVEDYVVLLKKEKSKYLRNIRELTVLQNPVYIMENKEKLKKYYDLSILEKTEEQSFIDLQKIFIKLLKQKLKEINTKEEFIDIMYKIRYYRYIYINKFKAIKDYEILENEIQKIMKKLIIFGCKNAFIKMISMNIDLNSKILREVFDTKNMDIENLRIKIKDFDKTTLDVEVWEKDIFEKKFKVKYKLQNSDIAIKKQKLTRIFN